MNGELVTELTDLQPCQLGLENERMLGRVVRAAKFTCSDHKKNLASFYIFRGSSVALKIRKRVSKSFERVDNITIYFI
ncbi:hypothetical protein M2137_001863 [Parabacteroides sp. PFB2-10]|nr:hypothetical protein [Parabacteroides sp. PFB2-10]